MQEEFAVRPIGIVHNSVKEPRRDPWESLESTIVVEDEWTPALDGIEAFSHIIVIYWMHRISEERRRTTIHVHPLGDPRVPLQGVFATRSPVRPNPFGLRVVALLERKGNVLRVRGLDAIDGSPVLDLKPYIFRSDGVPGSTVADWLHRLMEGSPPLGPEEKRRQGG